jgi:hypothetical protein
MNNGDGSGGDRLGTEVAVSLSEPSPIFEKKE